MQLYGFRGEGGETGPADKVFARSSIVVREGGGDRYVRSEIFHDFYDPIIRRCVEYRIHFVLCLTQISRPSVYHGAIFIIYVVRDKSWLVYSAFNHLTFYNCCNSSNSRVPHVLPKSRHRYIILSCNVALRLIGTT